MFRVLDERLDSSPPAQNDNVARLMTFVLALILFCSLSHAEDMKPLAKKLLDGIKEKQKVTCAVLNFPYTQNRSSTGSHLVSERLVTYMVQEGGTVVERRLLGKILEERKLWETGLMGNDINKQVGRLVGADAVVTGILTDLTDTTTEVFARIVKIDTGEIISAASALIDRIWKDPARLPRMAQPRSAVPGMLPVNSLADNMPKTFLPQSGQRKHYRPAPVPILLPTTPSSSGGSVK